MEFAIGEIVTIKTAAKDDPDQIKELLGLSGQVTYATSDNLIVHVPETNQLALVRKSQVEKTTSPISVELQNATAVFVMCYMEWYCNDGDTPHIVINLN
jgi:hypothetical protein